MPEPSRNFSSRWISRVRSRVAMDRARGQVPQFTDRFGRDERGPEQPVRSELGEPGASETSVLRPGMFRAALALTSITGSVLDQVEEGFPVIARCFHHRRWSHARVPGTSRSARIWPVVAPQVVTVEVKVPARCPGNRRQTFASRLEMSKPAARSCTISMTVPPDTYSTLWRLPRGGQGNSENLTLVLQTQQSTVRIECSWSGTSWQSRNWPSTLAVVTQQSTGSVRMHWNRLVQPQGGRPAPARPTSVT
jgi:hypothetical protein